MNIKKQWETTLMRKNRRDFEAVYYMGIHNRTAGGR